MPRCKRTACQGCGVRLSSFGAKRRCLACQRIAWRESRKKYPRPVRASRAKLRECDATIERTYQQALKVIKAQRWQADLTWKSQAALMVEAA
jgi:hypothetical protein